MTANTFAIEQTHDLLVRLCSCSPPSLDTLVIQRRERLHPLCVTPAKRLNYLYLLGRWKKLL